MMVAARPDPTADFKGVKFAPGAPFRAQDLAPYCGTLFGLSPGSPRGPLLPPVRNLVWSLTGVTKWPTAPNDDSCAVAR